MPKIGGRQPVLKPQDVVLCAKLSANSERWYTFAELGRELYMSASEVHAAAQRARSSQLVINDEEGLAVSRAAFEEFLLYGIKYAFPAQTGPMTRGMPTGVAAPPLAQQFDQTVDLAPVWPDADGTVRGISFVPLYPSVPAAARLDRRLYEILALIDALRGGAAREREAAAAALKEYIYDGHL